MFLENFFDDGNLLYGDVLDSTGVPKCTDLMDAWFEDFCTEWFGVASIREDVLKSLLKDSSRQFFTEFSLVFKDSYKVREQLEWDAITVSENDVSDTYAAFESFLNAEPQLDCELVSSSSISSSFFVFSKSDSDGEFVVKTVSYWKKKKRYLLV